MVASDLRHGLCQCTMQLFRNVIALADREEELEEALDVKTVWQDSGEK